MGRKGLMGLVMAGALALVSGCASMMSYQASQEEIGAIRAAQLSGGGAGVGVDLSSLNALTLHPVRQLGAAAVDAGMIYGAYYLLEAADEKINGDDEPPTVRVENSPGAQVNVSGDGSPASSGQSTDNSEHQ